jgi:hypothetical protein
MVVLLRPRRGGNLGHEFWRDDEADLLLEEVMDFHLSAALAVELILDRKGGWSTNSYD